MVDVVSNKFEGAETQNIPRDICTEPESGIEEMPEEAESSEKSEVKEPEFIPNIEAKLISLAKKAGISTADVHVSFRNIMNRAIQLEDVSPVEKQRDALQVLEMQISNYEAEQPKPDSVTASISYDDHEIQLVTKYNGRRFITIVTKDEKAPLILEHKKPMYMLEGSRDTNIRDWLKQKFACNKKVADSILSNIWEDAAEKQEAIDELANPVTTNQFGVHEVPGYEGLQLYTVSTTGAVKPIADNIARAIMDKLSIVSYDGAIWEYKNGIYIKGDEQTHEEITRIFHYIQFNGSIRNAANDILYLIINNHHSGLNPFNKFCGIPVANGVVEIDFETGEERLIDYSPDQKFSYKLPVKYDRQAPTEPVMALLRSWVYEQDINTLIQFPAQALLQKIFLTTYKKFYLFNGLRDAGKSAFLEFVLKVLSSPAADRELGFAKNDASIALNKLTHDKFAKSGLVDKIVNVYNDMSQFYMDNTGDLKELVGGIDDHNTEKKFEDQKNNSITAVHAFACNQLPFIAKKVLQDEAFWPKIEYVYFPFSHKKLDHWNEQNLTEVNCSGFFNLILDTMKRIRKQRSLVVDTDGEITLDNIKLDAKPLMRFIRQNMVPAHELIKYDKFAFMLIYTAYCRDKEIDDLKELTSQEPEEIQDRLDQMRWTERANFSEMMKVIDNVLRGFARDLYDTKAFSNYRTAVGGIERFYFAGSWKFKDNSKYKIEPVQLY